MSGSVSTSSLTAGPHVLSADVTDAGGLPGHAEITLTVNDAPTVSITSPLTGTTVNLGAQVDLAISRENTFGAEEILAIIHR